MSAALATLGVALGAAGCTSSEPAVWSAAPTPTSSASPEPTATPSPTPTASTSPKAKPRPSGSTAAPGRSVLVRRAGGFGGVNEALTVDAQGRWLHRNQRRDRRGVLTARQRDRLQGLLADRALAREAQRRPGGCGDTVLTAVVVGRINVSWRECGVGRPPVAQRIIDVLTEWTSL
ncbi:hypothetical protein [Pilimelia columellifera]|uniref:Uncharacterized protein n=1 Tax=Pilimelia columellifera subsp. columellifera TaxID=706583 RepID=A0ABN3NF23_9ACTN